MRVLAVIPSRFASTRLPGKPLLKIRGKPMVQWVYERAKAARSIERVVVATEDERIVQVVEGFGGEAVLTSSELASGTDRVAAVAEKIKADIYVNVQGDEPMMAPQAIDAAVELVTSGRFEIGTVMRPFKSVADIQNPNNVKVVTDRLGQALYFSRLPIPYGREPIPSDPALAICRWHVGLYVYSAGTLQRFRSLPVSQLESAEMLEQLRALADGMKIGVAEVDFKSMEVNTPDDLQRIELIIK